MTTKSDSRLSPDEAIEATAIRWIARRDRGLSELEHAAYQRWLSEDPRHAAAMIRPEKTWQALAQLAGQFPDQGGAPDAGLLARPRVRLRWFWIPLLAAAAAVALVYFARAPAAEPKIITYSNAGEENVRAAVVRREPQRQLLEDGSVVELDARTAITVEYTPAERRIRLLRGEAYFVVAKNPRRPFLVSANQVTVQAVGTAFSVGFGRQDLSVLVTEGKVQVDGGAAPTAEKPAGLRTPPPLIAGQRGVFDLGAPPDLAARAEMVVKGLTPAEIGQALSWRNLQLEFTDLALGEVVAEFNRYNRQKLVVADAATAAIHVGGVFRADNVETFVGLLESNFGVTATAQGGEIVLRKVHGP